MTLAAVLVIYFVSFAGPRSPSGWSAPAQEQGTGDASQAPTSPSPPAATQDQHTNPAATQAQPPNSATSKPTSKHGKKPAVNTSDCSSSPTPLKSSGGEASASAALASPVSGNTQSAANSTNQAATASQKPCPPPKIVIKNGGSDEPAVELKGNTTAEKASQQRYTTEQLTATTEGNLKKLAGHPLSTSQQEMVAQVKQFMEQSKKAVTAGDLERGHNLAMKGELLSEELLKP